jgi:hypothetical protein
MTAACLGVGFVVLVGALFKLPVGNGARRVQSNICRYTVTVSKRTGIAYGERLPLLCRELGRQRDFYLPDENGIAALVVRFDAVPELGTVGGPTTRQDEFGVQNATLAGVVMH